MSKKPNPSPDGQTPHHEKSFDDILEELDQEEQQEQAFSEAEEVDTGYLPVSNALDADILMHRDAHFGGKFEIMLDYYNKGGKGINPEFDIPAIETLFALEKQSGQNLAPLLLSGPEAEKVARAKEAYQRLRDFYEIKEGKSPHARLIADLILSEDEDPQAEINAIVAEKTAIVPFLIDLLRSDDFYDPLFPGYGHAPILAAKCLGLIGDKRAIISLFEALDQGDFSEEETVLKALKALGQPAKEFLLRVVRGQPLNQDNERAAFALVRFKEDPEVSAACLTLLEDPKVLKDIPLATYLALTCEGLQDPALRQKFLKMADDPKTPSILRTDIKTIAKEWQITGESK